MAEAHDRFKTSDPLYDLASPEHPKVTSRARNAPNTTEEVITLLQANPGWDKYSTTLEKDDFPHLGVSSEVGWGVRMEKEPWRK